MVLVTGATGFTGSWLVCHLIDSGVKVRALKRKSSSTGMFDQIFKAYFSDKKTPNTDLLEWLEGDITDIFSLEDAMENCDKVYHTAALVSFHKKDRQLLYDTNVIGTTNVVNTMLYKQIKTLIYVSSTAALGRSEHGEWITELTPWKENPLNSEYAKSKHKAELEVWRGIEEGLQAIIVNPGVISGFGDWNKGSCATYKKIYNGLNLYSQGINGVVDVQDVCKALLTLESKQLFNERFVLVSENITYQNYFNFIAKGFKKPDLKFVVNPWLGKFISRMAGILESIGLSNFFITKEIALSAVSINQFDSSKIIKTIDFKFKSISQSASESTDFYLRFLAKN